MKKVIPIVFILAGIILCGCKAFLGEMPLREILLYGDAVFCYLFLAGILIEVIVIQKLSKGKKVSKALFILVLLFIAGAVYSVPMKDSDTGIKTAKHVVLDNCKQYSAMEAFTYLLKEYECQVNFEYYPNMPEFIQAGLERKAEKTERIRDGILIMECSGEKADKITTSCLRTVAIYWLELDDRAEFVKSNETIFSEMRLKSFQPDFQFENLSNEKMEAVTYISYEDEIYFINWPAIRFWDEEADMQYETTNPQGNAGNLKIILYKRDQSKTELEWQYPLWVDLKTGKLEDKLQGIEIEGVEIAEMSRMRYLKGNGDFVYFLADGAKVYEVDMEERSSRLIYELTDDEILWELQVWEDKYFIAVGPVAEQLYGFYYDPKTAEKKILFENSNANEVVSLGNKYLLIKKDGLYYCYNHDTEEEWKIEISDEEYLLGASVSAFETEEKEVVYFEKNIGNGYHWNGIFQPEKQSLREIVRKDREGYTTQLFPGKEGFFIIEKNEENEIEAEEWRLER